jgi:RNA polymerase sigma-70 factor (ECF subfamily)
MLAAALAPAPAAIPARADASGFRLSFDVVYDEWFDFVWRSARRLGVDEAAVDDVTQDVFLVVHRRLSDFEGRSSLKTWLFSITLRVVSDWRRTRRRKGGLSPLPEDDALAGRESIEPARQLEKAEAVRLLHRLLDELDDDKRAVFVLAELEGQTAPEIATALDIPVNTVYSRLRVARERFEAALARHQARERSLRRARGTDSEES